MSTERKTSAGFYIVAIIGAFLIMALLVRSVIERTTPAPVGQSAPPNASSFPPS